MKPSVIVWDLETVPDITGFAAANDLVGKSDVEVREAIAGASTKLRQFHPWTRSSKQTSVVLHYAACF
jgi:hypothetical protein